MPKHEGFSGWGLGYRLSFWITLGLASAWFLAQASDAVYFQPDSQSYLEDFSYRAPIYPFFLKTLGPLQAVRWQWLLAFAALSWAILSWVKSEKFSAAVLFLGLGFLPFGDQNLFQWMELYLSSILMEGLWISYLLLLGLLWPIFGKGQSTLRGSIWGVLCYLPCEFSPRLGVAVLLCLSPLVLRKVWIPVLVFGLLWGVRSPSEFNGIGTIGLTAQFSDEKDLELLPESTRAFWQDVLSHPLRNTDGKKINGNTWKVAVPVYRQLFQQESVEAYDRKAMNAFFSDISFRLLVRSSRWWKAVADQGMREFAFVVRRQSTLLIIVASFLVLLLLIRPSDCEELFFSASVYLSHVAVTCVLAGAYDRYIGAFLPLLYLSLGRAMPVLVERAKRLISWAKKSESASVFQPVVYQ